MATRKHAKHAAKHARKQADAGDDAEGAAAGTPAAAVEAAQDAEPPTYKKDHEIKAARLAHGSSYDKLIAKGKIVAPTRKELSDRELDERLAKAEARRSAKDEA